MIKMLTINQSEPYKIFENKYNEALSKNQKAIEAIAISSYNVTNKEVESRFVNLKYIKGDEWIFFSNYESIKASSLNGHSQISALFYWKAINTQIRIKACISKTSEKFSDWHFENRSR